MNKAFTKENDGDDDDDDNVENPLPALPKNAKNYMTPNGYGQLKQELRQLLHTERPKVVETVAWAAGNGDRSENGDYIYGKKRLREIDRRIRYLTKALDNAEIVDPARQQQLRNIFFGATVTYRREDGSEHTVKIVGIDEADVSRGHISWITPVARTLMKAGIGDSVELHTPSGHETLEIIALSYPLTH